MYLTRNQAWWQHHRGFESHPPFQEFMKDGPRRSVFYFYPSLYPSLDVGHVRTIGEQACSAAIFVRLLMFGS